MNTTMYLNTNKNNGFVQAVGNDQGLNFCVHIFDRARKRIAVKIGLHF